MDETSEEVRDEKFVVFRRDDYARVLDDGIDLHDLARLALGDAVVIRTTDVYASAGLYAYAANIQTVLELCQLAPDVRKHQENVRDYFTDRADEADELRRRRMAKMPD